MKLWLFHLYYSARCLLGLHTWLPWLFQGNSAFRSRYTRKCAICGNKQRMDERKS